MTDLATAANQMREAGFQDWRVQKAKDVEVYERAKGVSQRALQAFTAGYHDAFADDIKPPSDKRLAELYMMGVAECEREKAFEARRIG